MTDYNHTTHFGFESIETAEKVQRVREVFDSVASRYDIMNDLMSFGIHHLWKHIAVDLCAIRNGQKILDLAGGTGDLCAKMSPLVGEHGEIILADINDAMLKIGRNRLIDQGLHANIKTVQVNAEQLPFKNNCFDCVIIGFGLRNVTNKKAALQAMFRVIKPGGRLVVLEFSKPTSKILEKCYDAYSFHLLPKIGKWIAKDEASYRYLAESIRMHPDQETLRDMMQAAQFEDCRYHNLTGGIVAVHKGFKY